MRSRLCNERLNEEQARGTREVVTRRCRWDQTLIQRTSSTKTECRYGQAADSTVYSRIHARWCQCGLMIPYCSADSHDSDCLPSTFRTSRVRLSCEGQPPADGNERGTPILGFKPNKLYSCLLFPSSPSRQQARTQALTSACLSEDETDARKLTFTHWSFRLSNVSSSRSIELEHSRSTSGRPIS